MEDYMSGHDRGWLHRQTVALDMQRELNESYPSFPDSLGKGATVRSPFPCPGAALAQSCTCAVCCG